MKISKLPIYVFLFAVMTLPACSSGSGESSEIIALQQAPEITVGESSQISEIQPVVLNDAVEADVEIQFLRVKNHLVECEGFQVTHCLLVQAEGSDEWLYLYEEIEGFDYQWGIDYEILVQVEQVRPIFPTDSSLKYSLVEVISSTQSVPDEAFSYTSRNSQERIVEIAPGQFSLLGQKEFTCGMEECSNVRSAIAQNQSTVLSFQHSVNPEEPLLLEAVLCSDTEQSFSDSCL